MIIITLTSEAMKASGNLNKVKRYLSRSLLINKHRNPTNILLWCKNEPEKTSKLLCTGIIWI